MLEGDQQQNPFLFDGDSIKLERAEGALNHLSGGYLSPRVIQVNVIGEVNNPGLLL